MNRLESLVRSNNLLAACVRQLIRLPGISNAFNTIRNNKLERVHSELVENHQKLERVHSELVENHQKLERAHSELVENHQKLFTNHQNLEQDKRAADQEIQRLLNSTERKLMLQALEKQNLFMVGEYVIEAPCPPVSPHIREALSSNGYESVEWPAAGFVDGWLRSTGF